MGALSVLDSLTLNDAEIAVVARFRENSQNRSFLPVADLLRAHGFLDESIQMLMDGVRRHPNFTAARVILVRELFHKGLIHEALDYLDNSPESLQNNVLAQRIRYKVYLLTKNENLFRELDDVLRYRQFHDRETEEISRLFQETSFSLARATYLANLEKRKISLSLYTDIKPEQEVIVGFSGKKEQKSLSGFHVVPLGEIFSDLNEAKQKVTEENVSLDSLTLASFYVKQGHLEQAIGVYERLLRFAPNDELLQRSLSETSRQMRSQEVCYRHVDEKTVNMVEQFGVFDFQIQFLENLLKRLD